MYTLPYLQQLKEIHNDRSRKSGFGGKSKKLGRFSKFMELWNVKSILDYGCGKGHILAQLRETYPKTNVQGYDPAIDRYADLPQTQFDCVFSNDVLEHIEPNYIVDVLEHINSLSSKYIWLRIDTKPARKKLSDGRNAHLILESPEWWMLKINNHIEGDIVYNELTSKGKFDVAIEKTNTK